MTELVSEVINRILNRDWDMKSFLGYQKGGNVYPAAPNPLASPFWIRGYVWI